MQSKKTYQVNPLPKSDPHCNTPCCAFVSNKDPDILHLVSIHGPSQGSYGIYLHDTWTNRPCVSAKQAQLLPTADGRTRAQGSLFSLEETRKQVSLYRVASKKS